MHRPEAFTAPPEGVDVKSSRRGRDTSIRRCPAWSAAVRGGWATTGTPSAPTAAKGGFDDDDMRPIARSISADSNSFGNSSTRSIAAEGRRRDEIRDEPVERVVSRCLCLSLWTPRGLFFDCSVVLVEFVLVVASLPVPVSPRPGLSPSPSPSVSPSPSPSSSHEESCFRLGHGATVSFAPARYASAATTCGLTFATSASRDS